MLALGALVVVPVLAQQPVFNESGGVVTLEAESGTLVNRAQSWVLRTNVSGYSGAGFLAAEPNNGVNYMRGFAGVAPEVQFRVRFSQTGTYHVWVRGYAAGPADDSVHVGLNGTVAKSAAAISEYPAGQWSWSRMAEGGVRTATLTVPTTGVHTVNVWMREDGFRFDKIILASNSAFQPSGNGPSEAARDVVAPPPALTVAPTSLSFQTVAGANAPSKTFSLSFSSGTLAWSVSSPQSWLRVSPASGTGAGTVTVSLAAEALSAGSYGGSVQITAAGATGSPFQVPVTLTVTAPELPRTEFFVAPNGTSSGDGTLAKPWDIFTAMAHPPAVKPGATIWIRGGEYGGHNTTLRIALVGEKEKPIIVRNYQGERATIKSYTQVGCCDAELSFSAGSYVYLWGLEFASPAASRLDKLPGVDVWAPGAKLINNVIHDTQQGIGLWKQALNGEVLGNVIYNNGYLGTDRGHGHGIYTQNDNSDKLLTDNIVFNQFGWGLHLYATSNSDVRNYIVQGNVAFNNGSLSRELNDNILMAGGKQGLTGMRVQENHFYLTPDLKQGNNQIGWLFSGPNVDAVVSDNYFIGGRFTLVSFGWQFLTMVRNRLYTKDTMLWYDDQQSPAPGRVTWDDNSYTGANRFLRNGVTVDFNGWRSATNFDRNASYSVNEPTGVETFLRPNRCEEGRANVVVYNWGRAGNVSIDPSKVLAAGMRYEIRDVQNYYGNPVLQGTYQGGTLSLNMNLSTVAMPHGGSVGTPVHTAPQFGVFVILQPAGGKKIC